MIGSNTAVLGNGFDLDLGLKTSYKNFLDSPSFKHLLESNHGIPDDFDLFKFILNQSELETWGGVEASLLDFVLGFKTQPSKDVRKTIRKMYEDLEKGIAEYLRNISYENIDRDSCAAHLLLNLKRTINVYSFNYTNINKVFNTHYDFVNRIHGMLEVDNAILGVQDENITNGLGFVKKSYHSNYDSKLFVEEMLKSEKILFFGHSMCMSDKAYFTSLFCNSAQNKCKELTFIVHDKNDIDMISDNIEEISHTNLSVLKEQIPMKFLCTVDRDETKEVIDNFITFSNNKYRGFCMPKRR